MLYLPLEFGEITMDGLVDSGAFINAMSWSDYNAIKMNSDSCVIKEYPQPPFKIECANAQLEQPIATADIQFNIGTYTFTDTFVILSKTSFPIIGLNFMRNHQAVIDTANGTINFPHVEMTLAMTDEKKNCNPKPLQIMTEGNQTLPPQQTTTVNAIVITTNTIDITGAVQPLPQFDETATIIVAPALATAHNKRINLRIANLTDFPHTIKNHTKLAELQILRPEDTKQIRPIDVATLTTLQDPDDTHMYVNELMKSSENEQNGENFWFPTPENPGNEEEHTPIQRRILKEIRELIQKEKLDPTKDPESRKHFLDMFQWEGSQIEGNDRKQLEQTIVEYNDIFARHRLDIGINNSFKVKLTPKDERPIYTQSLPVPINLKEDLTVELALMHRYGIIIFSIFFSFQLQHLAYHPRQNNTKIQKKATINTIYITTSQQNKSTTINMETVLKQKSLFLRTRSTNFTGRLLGPLLDHVHRIRCDFEITTRSIFLSPKQRRQATVNTRLTPSK